MDNRYPDGAVTRPLVQDRIEHPLYLVRFVCAQPVFIVAFVHHHPEMTGLAFKNPGHDKRRQSLADQPRVIQHLAANRQHGTGNTLPHGGNFRIIQPFPGKWKVNAGITPRCLRRRIAVAINHH
ncbi:hypothetical protein D3C71_1633440 [compost metagenome]